MAGAEEKTPPQKPNDAGSLYQKASALMSEDRIEEAKLDLLKILELDPHYVPAYYSLGLIRLKADDMPGAVNYLETAIRYGGKHATVYYLLGAALSRKGDLDKAKAAYIEATTRNPKMTQAFHDLGVLYYRTGEFDKSVEALQKALELDPAASKTMLMLGMAYIKDKRTEETIGLVTSLRAINDEVKAVQLENLLREVQAKRTPPEPDAGLLTPGGAPKKAPPAKSHSATQKSKGTMSVTGTAKVTTHGKMKPRAF